MSVNSVVPQPGLVVRTLSTQEPIGAPWREAFHSLAGACARARRRRRADRLQRRGWTVLGRARRASARAAASCSAAGPRATAPARGASASSCARRHGARRVGRSCPQDGAAAWLSAARAGTSGRGRGHAQPARGACGPPCRTDGAAPARARARAHAPGDREDAAGRRVAQPSSRPAAQVPRLRARAGRHARGADRGLLAERWARRRDERAAGDPHAARPARAGASEGKAFRRTWSRATVATS